MKVSRFRIPLLTLLFILLCAQSLPIPIDHDVQLRKPLSPSHSTVPIVLLHMYDTVPFFKRLGKLTGENKLRYAQRHGYQLVQSTPGNTSGILKESPCRGRTADDSGRCWDQDNEFDIDHSRAATFGKFKLAVAACRGREDGWLLWTDADAMIVNQTLPLESIIDDAYDLIFAYDWLMLNAGVLLLKCSSWNLEFMSNVYNARKFDKARALDQSSFQTHLDELEPSVRDQRVKVLPKYAMNVYTEEYRPGDFILHMAGKLYEATENGIFAIATQFDVLSTVDDIEDVASFFRGRRLLNYYSGTCAVNKGEKQKSCPPDDSRRILLNESLATMSFPNRYRHVGLRYYWLGDWKDKYDIPGWDTKKKSLPVSDSAPAGGLPMPPVPPLPQVGDTVQKVNAVEDKKKIWEDIDEGDEDDGDDDDFADQKDVKADTKSKDIEEDGSWSLLTWLLIGFIFLAIIGCIAFVLKKRRKIFSKIQ